MERGHTRSVGDAIRPFADARGVTIATTNRTGSRGELRKRDMLRLYNRCARFMGHGAADREFHKTLIGLSKDADYQDGREVVIGQSNKFLGKCCNMAKTTFTDQLRKHDGKTISRRISGNGHRFVARERSDGGDGRVTYHNAISLEPMMERMLEMVPMLNEQEELEADLRIEKARASAAVRTIRAASLALEENARARAISDESRVAARSLRQAIQKLDLEAARAIATKLVENASLIVQLARETAANGVENAIPEVSDSRHELHIQTQKDSQSVMLGEGERLDEPSPNPRAGNLDDEWKPTELAHLFPTLRMYMPIGAPVNWQTISEAGTRLLQPLGINRSCWIEAERAMGPYNRYVAIALVAELHSAGRVLTTPGRYFNGMVHKAAMGELDLRRSVWRIRKEAAVSRGQQT